MVGRGSEILERLAVEPKMIPPGLKIRSLGQTSDSGHSRRFDDVCLTSAFSSNSDAIADIAALRICARNGLMRGVIHRLGHGRAARVA